MRTMDLQKFLNQGVACIGALGLAASSTFAAAPTPSNSYSGNVERVAALPSYSNASIVYQHQLVRLIPRPPGCRLGGVFILPQTPGRLALIAKARDALAAKSLVQVAWSKTTDGTCVASSIESTAASTSATSAQASAPNTGSLSGWKNEYATTYRPAYRDFGQGKFSESIDPISGKLTLTHVDLVMPGPAGLDIRLLRHYESPNEYEVMQRMLDTAYAFPYGFGWSLIPTIGGYRGVENCPGPNRIMSTSRLPIWIDENGQRLPMVYTGNSVRTSTGVTIECTSAPQRPLADYATLPDGRKVFLRQTVPDGQVVGYGYPTKIEDKWGNYIKIRYWSGNGVYPPELGFATWYWDTLDTPPIELIQGGGIQGPDGREVRFEYSSLNPAYSQGQTIVPTDLYLKRISYGTNRIDYEADRVPIFALSSLVFAKYFLRTIRDETGMGYSFSTNRDFQTNLIDGQSAVDADGVCENLSAGSGAISRVTRPHGGVTTYDWESGGGWPRPTVEDSICHHARWRQQGYFSSKVKIKSTSDGGNWKYSYSDEGARPPYLGDKEWSRVDGPGGVVFTTAFTRYPTEGPPFMDPPMPPEKVGRIIQVETYGNDGGILTLKEQTNFEYGFEFTSDIQLSVLDANYEGPPFFGPNWRKFGGVVTKTTKQRAGRVWTTNVVEHDNKCRLPTKRVDTGDLTRQQTWQFEPTYCQLLSSETYAGSTLAQRSINTLSTDKKSVVEATLKGLGPGTLTTKRSYTSNGDLESSTDARGYRTVFDSYRRGTPQSEKHPVQALDGGTESAVTAIQVTRVVDDLGRITSETDSEGNTERFEYNGAHKPTLITPARVGSAPISFAYVPGEDTITRGSRTEKVKYDGFGRVTESNNGVFATTYRYDTVGRGKFVSYPGKSEGQEVNYDALDRPTQLIEPDPSDPTGASKVTTNVVYDDSANTITMTSPNGGVTKLTMEAFGDPSDGWVKKQELPAGAGTIEYTRNVFGQIETIFHTSADATPVVTSRTMKYDANKGYYLIEETHPELGLVKYERDNNGNMTGRTVGASGKTVYAYDGQNRLVSVTPPAGDSAPAIARNWYKTGKPKTVNAGGINRSYMFDENDNLLLETVLTDGVSRALSYAYDSLDSLTTVTYPSGRVSEFGPDLLGRPTKATPFVNLVSHHPSGMVKELQFANGTQQNFDEQRRPMVGATKIVKGVSPLLSTAYGYDKNANMLSILEPDAAARYGYARSATYDNFDRITSIGNEAFTYKGIGDFDKVKNLANAESTFAYDATTRRLQSISGATLRSYGYDVYGNVSSDGRNFAYGYDAYSTLRTTTGGAANSQYVYDGHQHMAKQTTNGVTKQFMYGMSGRLFGEYPATGTNAAGAREFFYVSGKMIGQAVK